MISEVNYNGQRKHWTIRRIKEITRVMNDIKRDDVTSTKERNEDNR